MRTAILSSETCKEDNEKFFNRQKSLREQKLVDTHPNGSRRVDRLFAVHPEIQRLLFKYYPADPSQVKSDRAAHCSIK